MGARTKPIAGRVLAVVVGSIVTVASPARSQEVQNSDPAIDLWHSDMEAEVVSPQQKATPPFPLTSDTSHASLEDLAVSVKFNKWDLVTGAAIAPDSESTAPSESSDIAQARFPNYRYSAGLDLPNFGWVQMDGRGIDSIIGINASFGVSYKKFFKPAVAGEFTGSWGIGTFLLALPYATIGGDYQWDSGWFLGGNVGGAVYYYDDFFPFPFGYVGVGYRW